MSYAGEKRKIRDLLEYLGYKYTVVKNTDGITERYMIKDTAFPPNRKDKVLGLHCNTHNMWVILRGFCNLLPDFIDYVYPFPNNPHKALNDIYSAFTKINKSVTKTTIICYK